MQTPETRHIQVSGQVQGVGFRPFVYRLARCTGLWGEVLNHSSGVGIVVQGAAASLDRFESRLRGEAPGHITGMEVRVVDSPSFDDFQIAASRPDAGVAGALLADQGICADCRREFFDPANRRFGYPFINCTRCGPRYSVCHALPYDRANTTWRDFALCGHCRWEHGASSDRRFHAVGISCPACGPSLFTAGGNRGPQALREAVATLARGGVLAVKGCAGFHLMVDAGNERAVARLKERKRRRKPLAVLAPGLDWVRTNCAAGAAELALLSDAAAPIVLLQSRVAIAERVASGVGMLGVMLPNSGIQLALMQELSRPLVATSGNVSGAPLQYKNADAVELLAGIADCILLHDLELTQGLDDSVMRVIDGKAVTLRLGRGLAPQVHCLAQSECSIGCGAQLKANVTVGTPQQLIAGPYVGDLGSALIRQRYLEQKSWLPRFLQVAVDREVTDLHPDYGSTIEADYRAPAVPHHVAHAMAAWLEHNPRPPFAVLSWDGVGLGPDGTVWGGECLLFNQDYQWQRWGSVRRYRLPAAADIARFPGRIANVLAGESRPPAAVDCSSMGRLIEGVASLAGLREVNQYEAQVAMEWEALAWRAPRAVTMDFALVGNDLDWQPLIRTLVDRAIPLAERALGFHQALARAAVVQCRSTGANTVLLAGGVFQNRLLVEAIVEAAEDTPLEVFGPGRIPPNDGGISLGQCVAHALNVRQQREVTESCV